MVARKKYPRSERCLTCPNKAQSRGLCWNCYHAAHGVMNRGERTEQELIVAKLILPSKRVGRPISSPFRKMLAKSQ